MKNGPKKIKFKKIKKGKLAKFEHKSNLIKFGNIALKALESGILSIKQIEAFKQILTKKTKRKFKFWVRVFPYISITAKPIGIRMGKGKGKILNWSVSVKSGQILFEIVGKNKKLLIKSLLNCKLKLPIKTKICYKNYFG